MAGDKFSGPAGEVCLSDDINSKYSTKSSFWDWWPEEFCPFPHNPLGSQKALADLSGGTAQGSSKRGTQEGSATSTLKSTDCGHEEVCTHDMEATVTLYNSAILVV